MNVKDNGLIRYHFGESLILPGDSYYIKTLCYGLTKP